MNEPKDLIYTNARQFERLRTLIEKGEGQEIEFKKEVPDQASSLGKEIAAFATSNAGTIVIGVDDNGVIVGLEDCSPTQGRKKLTSRIEGICTHTVQPSITPKVSFADLDGKIVAVIEIPKGDQPIYYSSNIPYIRQITASRPATPQEVIELILAWLNKGSSDPTKSLFIYLMGVTAEIIVLTDELKEREINPWLDDARTHYGLLAEQLRSHVMHMPEPMTEISTLLLKTADCLDSAAHQFLTMGTGWKEMEEFAKQASTYAKEFQHKTLESYNIAEDISENVTHEITSASKELHSLTIRLDQMAQHNRLSEVQNRASGIGFKLIQAAVHDVAGYNNTALAAIGKKLRSIEMMQIYIDGGASQNTILDGIKQANTELEKLLNKSPSSIT